MISKLQAASLRYSVREGNFSSYVYVGGLPTWYYGMHAHEADSRRPLLALPTALLEPRFRGAIRDLRYKDVVSRQVTVQDMAELLKGHLPFAGRGQASWVGGDC